MSIIVELSITSSAPDGINVALSLVTDLTVGEGCSFDDITTGESREVLPTNDRGIV